MSATIKKSWDTRPPRKPLEGQALANNRAGAIKRAQSARDRQLQDHMARLNWILG